MFCYVVAYYADYEGFNLYDENVRVFMNEEDAKTYAAKLNKDNHFENKNTDCYIVEKIKMG